MRRNIVKRLTRNEFESRFPRRTPSERIDGISRRALHIDRDTTISGVIEGPICILGDTHVVVTGVVEGPITVGHDAVLWCDPGLVEGRIHVDGAAFLSATVGSVRGDRNAYIYDPCE